MKPSLKYPRTLHTWICFELCLWRLRIIISSEYAVNCTMPRRLWLNFLMTVVTATPTGVHQKALEMPWPPHGNSEKLADFQEPVFHPKETSRICRAGLFKIEQVWSQQTTTAPSKATCSADNTTVETIMKNHQKKNRNFKSQMHISYLHNTSFMNKEIVIWKS